MPEPPENFDTPMGPVRRPPEIASGREAWGCMVWGSPDNQIVLDFFGPEISVEAMDAPPERPRHEVVARIRLDPARFLEVTEPYRRAERVTDGSITGSGSDLEDRHLIVIRMTFIASTRLGGGVGAVQSDGSSGSSLRA